MKYIKLLFLFIFLFSSCSPVATPTPTAAPTSTPTSTQTPKIYILRTEFSTTSDWSNIVVLDSDLIVDARLVDKKGDLTDFTFSKIGLGINQSLADAQALKEVSITVDFFIYYNTTKGSIPFLLQKGAINNSIVRFYNVVNGKAYLLLNEVKREGYVVGNTDVNPYNFSFDLKSLFQDVALLPTPTIILTPTQVGGGTGKLIFEYYKVAYEKIFPDLEGDVHVFISNWDGSNLTPITSGLNNVNHIESISADGQMVLVSSHPDYQAKGDLYLIYLNLPNSAPTKLADRLAWSRWPQAIFLDNARIAYVGRGRENYGGLYTVNIDGTNPNKLGIMQAEFGGMVLSDNSRIFYEGWTSSSYISLWWINIDGSGQGKLESNGRPILPNEFFYFNTGEVAAFSPDGTSIAWIPKELEDDCSELYLAFWTPDVRNGEYTRWVTEHAGSAFLPKDSPHVGKEIDTEYVEDYVRHCFILHVAPLSNLDNDIKIPLILPFDPTKDDFYYHKDYALKWWPDGSKILIYDGGKVMGRWGNTTGHYPFALYEVSLKDTDFRLTLLKVLSYNQTVQPESGWGLYFTDSFGWFRFSPDGRQILFTKYNYGNEGSMINILNLETMNYIDDFSQNITPDFLVRRIGDIYWLP